ncbi:hypothetical protein ACTMTJ_42595 [Phytohabitans sp. LJ34]|uniref:hypothetical protein n=1 Tax=Phytohabitans sp. LJ34 TaxID=3452217 RepID=UPI003F8CA211
MDEHGALDDAHMSLFPRLAAAAAASALLLAAAPASADPQIPGLAPELVAHCDLLPDPVNYGDGIQWWKLDVTVASTGGPTGGEFDVAAWPAYTGTSNQGVEHRLVAAMRTGDSTDLRFWITEPNVQHFTMKVDYGNVVHEIREWNNYCRGRVD